MKVKELIAKLQKFDPELSVEFYYEEDDRYISVMEVTKRKVEYYYTGHEIGDEFVELA